jgi:predicted amidophosphoribosyltransferase
VSTGRRLAAGWAALVDLVLPATCAGCGAPGTAWCTRCAASLAAAAPAASAPSPSPPGLPPVTAAGEYAGPLRHAIVAYKERGRHALAAVLGERLAAAARVAVARQRGAQPVPVLLIPVPATAAAARRRYGDHMVRIARRAAIALNRGGVPAAVAYPLRARRRPDFAGLSAAQRRAASAGAFAVRGKRLAAVRAATAAGVRPVLVDDVLTTGATISAAAASLRAAGVPVNAAAVIAATRRRSG